METATDKDIYVLVCERDSRIVDANSRPIVFEQFIDGDSASLESIKTRRAQIGSRYGETRIPKLEFIEVQE